MSERVNLTSIGSNGVSLLRLRTAADAPLARAYLSPGRALGMRPTLPIGGWNVVELCATSPAGGCRSI